MIEVSGVLIAAAFVAGVLMFLAPCTLPLVPAYLAFISGVDGGAAVNRRSRRRMLLNAFSFTLGFSFVFILFGVLAGALGAQFGVYRSLLTQIGGIAIILFGVSMLGVCNVPALNRSYALRIPSALRPGHPTTSLLIGAIFALGWTPCIGPILATIILLATDSATSLSGGFLLAVFSLGLALPFLLTALLYSKLVGSTLLSPRAGKVITFIGAIFLILIGLLLLTDNFALTILYGTPLFEHLRLDWIYDYL